MVSESTRPAIPQSDPPRSPRETLPTMYDLPSESPEEPGLPDEFHYLQPQLLSATLRLTQYATDQVFSVGDMNLYYDVRHPNWYKRPDWFAVVGVPRLYDNQDLRLSYVVWQEGINPFVVVELRLPGTEREDLGQTIAGEHPTFANRPHPPAPLRPAQDRLLPKLREGEQDFKVSLPSLGEGFRVRAIASHTFHETGMHPNRYL